MKNAINPDIIKSLRKKNLGERSMIRKRMHKRGFYLIIEPERFFAKGWAQKHFALFWTRVLKEYAPYIIIKIFSLLRSNLSYRTN
jgi:hypothetical protein